MYCSKCGNSTSSETKFCGVCGFKSELFEKNRGNLQKELLDYIKEAIKSPISFFRNSQYVTSVHAVLMTLIGVIIINLSTVITMYGCAYQTKIVFKRAASSMGILGEMLNVDEIFSGLVYDVLPRGEMFSGIIKLGIVEFILFIVLAAIIYGICRGFTKITLEFNQALAVVSISLINVSLLGLVSSLLTFISLKLNVIMNIGIFMAYMIFIYEGLKSSTRMKKQTCALVTIGAQIISLIIFSIAIISMM